MQANLLGQNGTVGSSAGLNVYAQLQEPSKKEGIWIKTEETVVNENKTLPEISKYKFERIEIKENLLNNQFEELAPISYPFCTSDGSGAVIPLGKEIFLFGAGPESYRKYVSKYTIDTKEFIRLTDMPVNFNYARGIAKIGNNILLFIGTQIYKYNLVNDNYEHLSNVPTTLSQGPVAVLNEEIYLFCSSNKVYKYNLTTNSCTPLTNAPYTFDNGSAVSINNKIYLFKSNVVYEYNPTTNTYTKMNNIPESLVYANSISVINNKVYIFSRSTLYEFNPISNSYTNLASMPHGAYLNIATAVNDSVFIFAKENQSSGRQYLFKYCVLKAINKSVLLKTGISLRTTLSKNLKINFSCAKIYDDNEIKDYPCYWGDGTKWNLIA